MPNFLLKFKGSLPFPPFRVFFKLIPKIVKLPLSQQVRVVIVDDQPAIRKDAATLIQQQPGFIVAGACGSVQEALELIPSISPDLLLLDISLGDGTGFDVLQKLSTHSFKVIFLTAYQEHAIRAIRYGALDYLLKPIDQQELQQALAKVLPAGFEQVSIAQQQFSQQAPPNRIVLRSQQYMQVVKLSEIVYCHSHEGYTTFYLNDERKVLTSKHIKEYQDILPASLFLRPHQSYLVNNRFIDKYHKDGYLILRNGVEIPVAMRRRETITEFFNRF
jgi:two-component system, LytTR family, response regulator